MPRIEPLDPTAAEGKPRELLEAVNSLLGATPNMTRTMARSSVLEAWLGFRGALRGGAISAQDGERLALAVAETNGCDYCLSAHTYLATNVAGLDEGEQARSRAFESVHPKSTALLAFAKAVVDGRGAVSAGDFEAARAAGLSDAELGDVVGHVAVNILQNYFNKAFEVEIDFPSVSPRERAAA